MSAYQPQDCDLNLFKIIESGDLDAAVALYETDAVFVVSPGRAVTGHDAIREVLQGMMSANAAGHLDSVSAVTSADGSIAITRAKGSSTRRGADGKPVTTHFHSVEVVRQQPDGTWRILIDDPSGECLV